MEIGFGKQQQLLCEAEKRTSAKQIEKGLRVVWKDGRGQIFYHKKSDYYRGLGWICQWMQEKKEEGVREEEAGFEHLTYMIDCSRNGVPSVPFLKKLLVSMALMGYDRLMLYTEDTYEIEGRPFFGWMRGRYRREEIRQLDEFAQNLGIELVPCIQTLAHLNAIFRWKAFSGIHDTADILNTGEEETYALIEEMIRTWSETVSSRVINIGMDEAEMIGRGSFLNRFGYQDRLTIMQKHLRRVLEICKKYGFTCMMWSDMFFKLLSGEGYHSTKAEITEETRKLIPQNVELVYWDYYTRDESVYCRMIENHKKLTEHVGFAGGAWKWNGYAPLLEHSIQAGRLALSVCRKYGIKDVMVTGWGDDGSEASQASVLPVLSLYAESCYAGQTDEAWISERMYACTGESYEDFLLLDLPNLTPDNPAPGRVSVGPAKYLLYQDAMLGIYDRHVDPDTYPRHFAEATQKLSEAAERSAGCGIVFETLSRLCLVLEDKSSLGVELTVAYKGEDRETLKLLVKKAEDIAQKTDEFRKTMRRQWFAENKSFGWEVLDIRLGGVCARLESVRQRVTDYLEGRISCLEELEEERLVLDERINPGYRTLPLSDNNWKLIATASVM